MDPHEKMKTEVFILSLMPILMPMAGRLFLKNASVKHANISWKVRMFLDKCAE
jgi:VanZ family protein